MAEAAVRMSDIYTRSLSEGGNVWGLHLEYNNMSNFTFDEAGSVAQLPKELGEAVTSMLGLGTR